MSTTTVYKEPASDVIQAAERALADWAYDVCAAPQVSFVPQDGGVTFYLWDIVRASGEYGGRQTAQVQARARYLVLPPANDTKSRQIIADLFAAALEHPEYEVGDEITEWWLGVGVFHRPSFALTVPLRLERKIDTAPRVVGQAQVERVELSRIQGRIVGPQAVPVAGAVVRLRHSDRQAVSNRHGAFCLEGVPTENDAQLSVQARACVFAQKIEKARIGQEEIIIEIQFESFEPKGE